MVLKGSSSTVIAKTSVCSTHLSSPPSPIHTESTNIKTLAPVMEVLFLFLTTQTTYTCTLPTRKKASSIITLNGTVSVNRILGTLHAVNI